ncbi:hypothetical protein [Pseudomonas sp. 35 E 8]|uniref:hypothetical protein n=1 Tax=Pseudomonas sp. 35 E 8 TaxID=1844103 RepID=UPI0008127BAF|nr:hypothetical protein [Pseudomonas sp. 35 E 8]CRM61670.1 hypothetical protein [Pseudomonas sp. 35 E 8]
MENQDKLGLKPVSAKDLIHVLNSYHKAISKLGSGMISISSALMESDDQNVKAAAEESWGRLKEFVGFMEQAAERLETLAREGVDNNGE